MAGQVRRRRRGSQPRATAPVRAPAGVSRAPGGGRLAHQGEPGSPKPRHRAWTPWRTAPGRPTTTTVGSVDLRWSTTGWPARRPSAAAGQGPLFPMLAQLPLQEAGAHLLAGDLPAAAAALRGAAPLPVPLVDEVRSPVVAAWVAFLQGDLVSAAAALDLIGGAAAECDEVAHGVGPIFASMAHAGIYLERREHEPAAPCSPQPGRRPGQRPPVHPGHGRHLDRPAGHRPGGPGRRAGILGPGTPGPRPRRTTRSGHSSRSRNSVSRSPWTLPKRAR